MPQSDLFCFIFSAAPYGGDCEDPYPSLSDYHDYEPNLEFDDSDLQQQHPEDPDGKNLNFQQYVGPKTRTGLQKSSEKNWKSLQTTELQLLSGFLNRPCPGVKNGRLNFTSSWISLAVAAAPTESRIISYFVS